MCDEIEFFEAMAHEGVRPIKRQDRQAVNTSRKPRPDPSYLARRLAAQGGDAEGFTLEPQTLLHPLDPIEWKRDGVQEGVYRNLRMGRYTHDARLNLSSRPLAESAAELIDFVNQCYSLGIRTVLVHFGRSRDKQSAANRIKSCLNLWLPQLDVVMAFHSAQQVHGGTGAIYVMLRKNEQQRQMTLEQHQQRRKQG